MAMNPQVLGSAIAQAILSPQAPPEMQAQIIAQWQQIAGIILAHIEAFGVVTVSVPIIPVATSGGAGATTAPVPAIGTIA